MGLEGSRASQPVAPAPETSSVDVLMTRLRVARSVAGEPLFVGIDGRSGVGKLTLAASIAIAYATVDSVAGSVTVIEGDQFYAGGSAESWDRESPAEKAARVIDWPRQRAVLEQLRVGGVAEWFPFDWAAEDWDADVVPLDREPIVARAGSVVVLEGVYSCRPELHDLLDLRVLLDIPHDLRRRRLLEREGDAYRSGWEARWSMAEDYYKRGLARTAFEPSLIGTASW